jgi:hypothetical protein
MPPQVFPADHLILFFVKPEQVFHVLGKGIAEQPEKHAVPPVTPIFVKSAVLQINGAYNVWFIAFVDMIEMIGRPDDIEKMKQIEPVIINFIAGPENLSMHTQFIQLIRSFYNLDGITANYGVHGRS